MTYIISFIGTIIYYCLVIQQVSGEGLPKPTLTYSKDTSANVIIIGDKVEVECKTASPQAEKFFLKLTKREMITWTNNTAIFTFTFENIKQNESGEYVCFYCDKTESKCSDSSDSVYIYVRGEFPGPDISVSPRRIILPGDKATITCTTYFENVVFKLYKDDKLVKEYPNGQSTISYDINNANETHGGAYACKFQRKLDNLNQIVSSWSNPTHLKVKDLPKPLIADEMDPNGNKIKLSCKTEFNNQILSFQLQSENNGIESETSTPDERNAIFIINKPRHTTKYFCTYQVKIDFDMAFSRSSDVTVINGIDYTAINIFRLIIAAIILILIGVILWKESVNFKKSEENQPPKLPSARERSVKLTEDTKVVFQSDVQGDSVL